MSANDPARPLTPEETTVLHLGKFSPGQAAPATEAAEESPTLIFRQAAAETAAQSAQPVVASKDGNAIPPKEMLGAVAYCYAKGVYSSSEIEGRMLRDAELRKATHEEIPDAQAIRRFRRLNREAILQTLEKWYRKLRKARPATGVMPGAQPPAPSPVPAAAGANTPGESTAVFIKREASDRLDKAAFIDNMERE